MDPRSSKPNSRPTVRRPFGDTDAVRRANELQLGASDAFLGPPKQSGEVGRLGPYRILGVLGRGGMGTVYRAEDPRLNRQLALKVLLPEFSADPRAKARFRREARAQAKVEHDNIIPIWGVEEANGVAYIVMPLLKGQTLSSALRQNPRPPVGELVRIGREMAEGLAAAHAVDLIHRDIKPSNVWLEGSKRRVKILDFGLARGAGPMAGSGDPLTAAGAIVGTPAYMAPEQARSQPVDQRSDIFSLGIVLHEMATGQKPFTGESSFDIMAAVVAYDPPAVSDVPTELSELIQQMLAKNPTERPQTCGALAEELEAIERGLTVVPVRVIPLSATPGEPDPWAEIDTTHAEPITTVVRRSRHEKPARPRSTSPKWLWPAAGAIGALVLVGLVVLAVNVARRKPKETETAEQKDKSGAPTKPKEKAPTRPSVSGSETEKPKDSTPDARNTALEAILTRGGSLVSAGLPIPNLEAFQQLARMRTVNDLSVSLVTGESIAFTNPTEEKIWDKHPEGSQVSKAFTDADVPLLDTVCENGCEQIAFSGQDVTDTGMKQLLTSKGFTGGKFRVLEVQKCSKVTDETLAHAAAIDTLTKLYLNDVNVTDEGVKHLLPRVDTITDLRLQNIAITDAAIPDLEKFARLTVLDLKGTKVSAAGAQRLAAALPECWIRDGDGKELKPEKGAQPAKPSAGLVFDGKSTFVKVPALKFDGKLPITIEAWITPDTVDGTERHICLLGEPGGGIGLSKTGALGVGFSLGAGTWENDYSRKGLEAGKRVHVAAVVTKDQMLLFIDGKEVGIKKVALGTLPKTEAPAVIGRGTKFAGESNYFHGTMHGLRVSNTARYEKDFKPAAKFDADAGTVALYRFDEGKGTKLTDSSKNKAHGTIESGTWAAPKK